MAEVWFYQPGREGAETVLVQLLRRGLQQRLRLSVQTISAERVQHWSQLLWSQEGESFLAHGADGEERAASQPIWITASPGNPNSSSYRFHVDGHLPDASWIDACAGEMERISLLIDSGSESRMEHARVLWSEAKRAGLTVRCQRQNDAGRWSEVAAP